jgi:F-type H+-transporting ATPase subunit b
LKRILLAVSFALALTLPVAAQHATEHESGGSKHEEESGNTIYWKVANFVLFAGLLGYLISKKAGGYFSARTSEIRKGLDDAARMKAEAGARYAEIEKRLANIGAEIESLRTQARQESAAEGERVREETGRELRKLQVHAEQEIAAAGKAAQQELRAYSASLAVDLAAKRIRDRITPEADSAITEEMVKDLDRRPDGRVRAS